MNIIEAIKSGRLHRRKIGRQWYYPMSATNQNDIAYSIEDILADDWEIEEVRVTITYSEFDAAWMEAVRKNKTFEGLVQQIEFRRLVAKELGL